MTEKHYIELPILLSVEQVRDMFDLDARPFNTDPNSPLQTLADLNSQIITQLSTYCIHRETKNMLPLSITVTALLPLTRGLRNE